MYRNYTSREEGRRHTDPTSSRFNSKTKYHQRGRTNNRPVRGRGPTGVDDLDSITVSIDRHLTTDGNHNSGSTVRGRFVKNSNLNNASNQTKWWRVSVPQAGTIGKENVMVSIKSMCQRDFQAYHYFIDRDTNTGVFFVNSQQDADMLRRANRKIETSNSGKLSIMVSPTSCPAPFLDADLRKHFKDYLCNRRFNSHTFQLSLSNLTDDEDLSSLGIYPQLNKQSFVRDVIDIINTELPSTRILDLGSNNISNLYEFRNLQLNNLEQISLASNKLDNIDALNHLKQLPNLHHLFIKDNPISSVTNRNFPTRDDFISAVRQKLPQLRRIDDSELPTQIGFAVDNERVRLPASASHCVPTDMETFLAKFIEEYYRLFDTRGRGELHACYHDKCMFSLCVAPSEGSIVPTKQYKFGPLIYDSRNLKKIFDDNKRATLLRQGKPDVLDFLRIKFPLTKHEGKSFHVDVISAVNNRAIFSVNGLYREVDQAANGPIRTFQRTFTCAQTPNGVLIIADHIMIMNPTDIQVLNMNRSAPPTGIASSTAGGQAMESSSMPDSTTQNQMTQKFSQESGMNYEYSALCLSENEWNYEKAAKKFQECRNNNVIPPEAFMKR